MTELTPKQIKRRADYQKNKEKVKAQMAAKYAANKEHYLEYQKAYRQANRALINTKSRIKRTNRLQWAIEYLGGKCSSCGIVYDPCVYDFHHTNPEQKEFTISEDMLVSKLRFEAEVKKCILLCANCHRMEHKQE